MRYPKINSVFQRDDKGKFIGGAFSSPEFDYLYESEWVGYEKWDGTNTRFYADGIQGRSENSQWNQNVANDLATIFESVRDQNVLTPDGIEVLYGETVGPKLQGNPHGITGPHEFVLFDARLASGRWLEYHELEVVAAKVGLTLAAEVDVMSLEEWVSWMRNHEAPEDVYSEGYILRPEVPLLDMYGHRIQTKLKWLDFA